MGQNDNTPASPIRRLLARNVRYLLNARKMTPPELARKAHLNEKTMNNLVRAGHDTRIGNLEKIATALGLKAWHLLCFDMEATPFDHGEVRRLLEIYARADTARRRAIMTVASTLDTEQSEAVETA